MKDLKKVTREITVDCDEDARSATWEAMQTPFIEFKSVKPVEGTSKSKVLYETFAFVGPHEFKFETEADRQKRIASMLGEYNLGSFSLTSNNLRVTDPCYGRSVWCCGVLDNVKLGLWEAQAVFIDGGRWDLRVSELRVNHSNNNSPNPTIMTNIDVGVDSGQAGFFQDNQYPDGDRRGNAEEFYRTCCDLTLNYPHAGVLDNGTVSSSGYGDGSYDCFIERDPNDEIVAAKIVFIGDEEDV